MRSRNILIQPVYLFWGKTHELQFHEIFEGLFLKACFLPVQLQEQSERPKRYPNEFPTRKISNIKPKYVILKFFFEIRNFLRIFVFHSKILYILRCHLHEIQTVTAQILQGQFMKLRKSLLIRVKKFAFEMPALFDCKKFYFEKNR